MWLLRNQVYDSDIKAFTDANEALIRMASGKAKAEDERFKVGFKIVFTNNSIVYTIEKFANFETIEGQLVHSESQQEITKTINFRDIPVLDKEEQNKIINTYFIPNTLLNYALLQGESMDRLVDLSSKKAI